MGTNNKKRAFYRHQHPMFTTRKNPHANLISVRIFSVLAELADFWNTFIRAYRLFK